MTSSPNLSSAHKTTPTISIGLPVYNGEDFLAETIESILSQKLGDLELIISDNASTDETLDICESYLRLDSRVRCIRQPENVGAAENYNFVFRRSTSKYFKWAAHDDLLKPQFLSECINEFERHETPPTLVHPRAELIDEAGQLIDMHKRCLMHIDSDCVFWRVFSAMQAMSLVTAVFGVFPRTVLERTQLIGSYISSDYVLLLECALLGKIIRLDGEPLFQRRIHQKVSRSANKSEKELLHWFDPKASSVLSERQRLLLEYSKSILSVGELNILERQLCLASLFGGIAARRLRVAGGRLRQRLFSTD